MANKRHLAILRRGIKDWNAWRQNYPDVQPDLTKEDLSRMDLRYANLSHTNLSHTKLMWANLSHADMNLADLTNTLLGATSFANIDLRNVKGLDAFQHYVPSTIGIDTLIRSEGQIPEAFLRGCGVPDSFIEYLPALLGAMQPIQFYSCFISHSSKDQDFVQRLYERMQSHHLCVWFAPEDMKGGAKLHDQIDQAIRVHDKLVLVLSEQSIQSEWVMTEIRKARKAELRDKRRKLFPIRLVDMDTLREWECFDADTGKDLAAEVREYYIPDFTRWKDHDSFERAFPRFLKDLQATESPPVPRSTERPKVASTHDTAGPLSKQAQQQHLREIIEGKTCRLRHLEKREAVQGVATDPKDRIEIEDLRREIGELEVELRRMGSIFGD